MWLSLNRSTAPSSEGFRAWFPLPGTEFVLDGEEAIDDVEVAGEGGFVGDPLEISMLVVITFPGGFFMRCERLRLRFAPVSAEVCVGGPI